MQIKRNTLYIFLVVVAIIAIGLFLALRPSSNQNNETENPNQNTEQPEPVPGAKTYQITIGDFTFIPKAISINKGDTVVWTNIDSVSHTVTSDSGSELASELLAKGDKYSHTFNAVGTYNYHCTPHPNMKATIIVS